MRNRALHLATLIIVLVLLSSSQAVHAGSTGFTVLISLIKIIPEYNKAIANIRIDAVVPAGKGMV